MSRPKVSVFLGLSLDGYIAGKEGDLSWLSVVQTDPPENSGFEALLTCADVLILGRNTYDTVLKFDSWPYHTKRVIVLTHRQLYTQHGEEAFNGALMDLLNQLGQAGHQHVYLDGGAAVGQGLKIGVVDELTLNWIPVILGQGLPLFTLDLPMSYWQLQTSTQFPSGLVQAKYVPSTKLSHHNKI